MNHPLAAAGAFAALLALASCGSAYHIGPGIGPNGGSSPETWTGPAAGAIVICEHGDLSDRTTSGLALTGVSEGGQGGLCSMSIGWVQTSMTSCVPATASPAVNEGRSTGLGPDYNGGSFCLNDLVAPPNLSNPPPISAPSPFYVKIQMWDSSTMGPGGLVHAGSAVPFQAEIGGQCSAAGITSFVYDDQYAYTVSNGHVAGFPATAPALGSSGTYTVVADPGPATPLGSGGALGCPTHPPQ